MYYQIIEEPLKKFKGKRMENEEMIKLIDSSRHIKISLEVTTPLRIIDGALFVVGCIEGVYRLYQGRENI